MLFQENFLAGANEDKRKNKRQMAEIDYDNPKLNVIPLNVYMQGKTYITTAEVILLLNWDVNNYFLSPI